MSKQFISHPSEVLDIIGRLVSHSGIVLFNRSMRTNIEIVITMSSWGKMMSLQTLLFSVKCRLCFEHKRLARKYSSWQGYLLDFQSV